MYVLTVLILDSQYVIHWTYISSCGSFSSHNVVALWTVIGIKNEHEVYCSWHWPKMYLYSHARGLLLWNRVYHHDCALRFPPRKNQWNITIVSQKSTMGGAPYKFGKEEGGRSFECFRIWSWKSAHIMFTIFGSSITVGKDINFRDLLFLFTEYVPNPYIYWMYQSLMFGGLILPFLFSCTYMFAQCMNVKFADYVDIDFFPSSFPFHSWAQDFYGERLASSVSAM